MKHIQRVLPETQRFSSLSDGNFQVALEHRDLDLLPHAEVQKIDYWLEELVDDFGKAARESVSQLLCLRQLYLGLHVIALPYMWWSQQIFA